MSAVAAPAPFVDPCSDCASRPISICRAAPHRDLQRLAEHLTVKEYAAGEPVLLDGDACDHVFNITEGSVKVFRSLPDGRRAVTGFLFRGDFLGLAHSERALFGAEALEPAKVCRFPRKAFKALLMEMPQLETELLERASHELEQAQDQLLLLSRKTALERVASFLLALSRRAQERLEPADPVRFPMIRADMADYLGLTTETVSRCFGRLKTSGVIRLLPGNQASILRPERLAQLAEGEHAAA